MGTDWTAVGNQTGTGLWYALGVALPLLFLGWLALLLIRAWLHHGRYRVVRAFGDDDRRAVREAVERAERRTVGEIVPVVVERSDPHPAAEWLSALTFVLVGSSALLAWMPWHHPLAFLGEQAVLGLVGFGLARWLPAFKRLFVFEDRASAVAHEQAFQEFYGNGLYKTVESTGVLLFVSLFERRVIVLADEGIAKRVDADFWSGTDAVVLDGIRRGSLRDGLVAGVERVAELLASCFPWQEGDRNEIPDRVIVRRE